MLQSAEEHNTEEDEEGEEDEADEADEEEEEEGEDERATWIKLFRQMSTQCVTTSAPVVGQLPAPAAATGVGVYSCRQRSKIWQKKNGWVKVKSNGYFK